MTPEAQKNFISSIAAAERFDVTNDYVTMLCRRGKILGSFVGRMWYVDAVSLEQYLATTRATSAVRYARQREQLKQTFKEKQVQASPVVAAPIRYEAPAPAALPVAEPEVAFADPEGVTVRETPVKIRQFDPFWKTAGAFYAPAAIALMLVVGAYAAAPRVASLMPTMPIAAVDQSAALSLAPIRDFFCNKFYKQFINSS